MALEADSTHHISMTQREKRRVRVHTELLSEQRCFACICRIYTMHRPAYPNIYTCISLWVIGGAVYTLSACRTQHAYFERIRTI